MRSVDDSFAAFRRTGDPKALAAVFDRTAAELLALARHLAAGQTEAEDLVQATFLSAIESAPSFEPGRAVVPWLCGVLANHARMARRRGQRQLDRDRLAGAASEDPAAAAENAELHERLVATIDSLPEAYRPVLRLHLTHGLDPHEIAATLERPRGTVRSQLSRGLDLLRRALPATLAGGAAVTVTSGRGLAAVRGEVLSRLPATTTGVTAGLIGGFVTMKKLAATAAAGLGLALIWAGASVFADVDAPLDDKPAEPYAVTGQAARTRSASSVETTEDARAIARTHSAAESESLGSLLVRASFETDGAAAADVGVWVASPRHTLTSSMLPPRIDRTGPDGTLVLEDLAPGRLAVHLDRCRGREVEIVAGRRTEIALVLPEGMRLTGSVVDPSERPVGGARVYARGVERDVWGRLLGVTNEAGEFAFRGVGVGTHVWAAADGYASSLVHISEGSAGAEASLRLALRAGGVTVSGRVVDSSQRPVSRAVVAFAAQDELRGGLDEGGWQVRVPYPLLVRTDEEGRFRTDRVAPGRYLLFAHAPDLAGHAPARQPIEIHAGRMHETLLQLPRAAAVTGTFRDAHGLPVRGARVVAAPRAYVHGIGGRSGFTHFVATTDDAGAFRIDGITPGPRELRAAPVTQGGTHVDHEVDLAPGELHRWNPTLRGDAGLVVRVLDSTGNALAGWKVLARAAGAIGDRPEVTDGAGRARFRDLASVAHTVSVHAPRADPWASFPVHVHRSVLPAGREVVVRVPRASMQESHIRCRVLAADGEPAGSVPLLLFSKRWPLQVRTHSAERTGKVAAGPLPPDTYRVLLVPGDAPRVDLGEVTVAGDQDVDLGDVRLPSGGRVLVRLGRVAGAPVESPNLELRDPSGRRFGLTRTGRVHAWGSRSLRPGRYELWILGANIAPLCQDVWVTAGTEADLAPRLLPGTPATIVVRFPSGPAGEFASGTLEVRAAGGGVVLREWMYGNLRERTLELTRGFAPGRYTLAFATRSGQRGTASFRARADRRPRIEVRLR